MKKSRGVLSLVVTAVLIVLLGYTTIFGFGAGATGSAKNIKLGLDLAGGVSITYQVKEDNPSSEDMADTIQASEACGGVQYRGAGLPGGKRPDQY